MPGEYIPPEPPSARNDLPGQEPEVASPPGPSQPVGPLPGAPPAGANQTIRPEPAQGAGPAATQGAIAPAAVGAGAPPSPPGTPLDPAAVTGPPWPRLVAADGAYTPPRLVRWPIVVGILLFAGWIAAAVALGAASTSSPTSSPSSAFPYVLTAGDAHFTATFPSKPQRVVNTVGTTSVIVYVAPVSGHGVAVTHFSVPAASPVSLNAAINGVAANRPGGKVVSRRMLTYLGQPAEDAVISFSGGVVHIMFVRFGSSVYSLEGVGSTASSFAHDYTVLLASFRPLHP